MFVTRLLAESRSFLWHHLADLVHNHLATLAVSTINSDCFVTMQTGESMQRVKLVTRNSCPHTLWFSRCWGLFLTWGPALLKCYRPRAVLIRHWWCNVLAVIKCKSTGNEFHLRSLTSCFLWWKWFQIKKNMLI